MDTRRRRRLLAPALVVAAPLLILTAADRLTLVLAQRSVADSVQETGFGGGRPEVSIKGFPFLAQKARHRIEHAVLSAGDIDAGDRLRISRFEVTARDVRTDPGATGVIGTVTGTATVGFADLAEAAGRPGLELSAAGREKVAVNADVPLVAGAATARVTKQGDGIRIHEVQVSGTGGPNDLAELGDLIGIADLGALDVTVPVRGLPLGLAFNSLSVTSDGIVLRIAARNVRYGRPPAHTPITPPARPGAAPS